MNDEKHGMGNAPEPDTEGCEQPEDEALTEEHEATGTETQVSEVAIVELLAEEVHELRKRADERDAFLDKLQRSKADFINYQKRVQRERERWSELAIEALCLRVLPALDDLDRALTAAEDDHDLNSLIEGLRLIQAKFLKALSEDGVSPLDAQGQPFDPAYHEAVAHLHNPAVPDHTVVEELRRGYLIGSRLLRAAQVVVAMGGEKRELPLEEEDDTADLDLPDDEDAVAGE
ncbi:nucleotide exchange factor GrpE [bacterium]|nr:nucleotide exchange factor GrpE [bacterium]